MSNKQQMASYRWLQAAVVIVLLILSYVAPSMPVADAATSLSVAGSATEYLTVGQASGGVIAASGGTSPYNISLAGGQLPPGLTLATDGTLSGIPLTAGIYAVTVDVQDSAGATVTQPVIVRVGTEDDITEGRTPSVSLDGRYVAYWASHGTANIGQVLVRDRLTGTTVDASTTADGVPASAEVDSSDFAISQNGRFVLIETDSWMPDGTHAGYWIKDLMSGSLTYAGEGVGGGSLLNAQAISDDGATAAIVSGNQVHVLASGEDTTPALCPGDETGMPRITPDGRFVAFAELEAACTGKNGVHVVVLDRNTDTLSDVGFCNCISPNSPGLLPRQPGISNDGRYVSFWSDAQIDQAPSLFAPGVFVVDRTTGTTTPVPESLFAFDDYNGGSSLSADGSVVMTRQNWGDVCIFNRTSGYQACHYDGTGATGGVANLSADGNTLVWEHLTGSNNWTISAFLLPTQSLDISTGGSTGVTGDGSSSSAGSSSGAGDPGKSAPTVNPCIPAHGSIAKELLASLKCTALETKLEGECAVAVAAIILPQLKSIKALKTTKGLYDLRKVKKSLRPLAKLINDLKTFKFGSKAPRGFKTGADVIKKIKTAHSAYEILMLLPQLVKSLSSADFSEIALDLDKYFKLTPCVQAAANAIE